MLTQDKKTSFWVISDTHLIADSLHDDGQAFSQMQKTSQGKDLYYQETALSAFVRMAEEKKPAAIIVTGDVTFNGERVSAERFAEIFKPLTKTKLLVLLEITIFMMDGQENFMVKSNIMLGKLVLECGVIFLELLMKLQLVLIVVL
jgi:3',5'-cyclic AMP phosphodiesterase CpdA